MWLASSLVQADATHEKAIKRNVFLFFWSCSTCRSLVRYFLHLGPIFMYIQYRTK